VTTEISHMSHMKNKTVEKTSSVIYKLNIQQNWTSSIQNDSALQKYSNFQATHTNKTQNICQEITSCV